MRGITYWISKLNYLMFLILFLVFYILTSPSTISNSMNYQQDYWFEKWHKVSLWMIRNGVKEDGSGEIYSIKRR